jgi:DNA-binding beta-propeller fold protein YncE
MRSRDNSLWGILFVLVACVFVGSAEANTLFSIDSHKEPAAVRIYSIEGNELTNPVTISEETIGLGPVGIAASEDLGLVFITYENVDDVVVINSKTLEKVTKVDTGVSWQSGIVADDVKDKIYIIERETDSLFVYTWNETNKTLVFDVQHDLPDLYSGMGIALDGDYLYVTDATATVRCYNTTTTPWTHETDYDITLPTGFKAYGIAVYNDGSGNRFGYFGGNGGWWGWPVDDRFIKVDLDNPDNRTIITPSEGHAVTGIATDPDTGLVYASIDDGSNRVFSTSLNELYSIDTNVIGPADMVVGGFHLSPFDPNKTDDIEDCVAPRDGQITYTINYDYQWNDANDPNPEDFDSIIIVDELSMGVDFLEGSSDPCWIYHEDGHYVTYDVEPDFWDETSDIELAVQVNRKVPPGGKIENIVKVKAYLDSQEHIGSSKIETDVCSCTGYGKNIYVDIDASEGSNDGSTWQDAYTSLQSGLAESWPCDEIWVAKSENAYKPTEPLTDPNATFQLVSGVGVYGGFIGGQEGEEHRYERNWFENETILSGHFAQYEAECVVTSSANAPVSVIDGFTIKDGSIAGVYCEDSSPIIQHNKIMDNDAGIYCLESKEPVIKNNWLYRNKNGIYIPKTHHVAKVRNNTVVNNENMGIYFDYGVGPEISDCIIWGHPSDTNDLVGCTATYSCFEDGDEGAGNISSDPCFADGADNYLLKSVSACIDAGDPNGSYAVERDINKQFRVLDGDGVNGKRVDMGADEYCNETSSNEADFNNDGIVNYIDFAKFGAAWLDKPGDPNWEEGKYDLNGDGIIVDVNDLVIFAEEWLWMSCDGMKGIGMMEMMMGMGGGMGKMAGGESMLMVEQKTESQQSYSEPSVEEQIEQIKQNIAFLYEVKDQVDDEEACLGMITSLEEMLKELEDSQ